MARNYSGSAGLLDYLPEEVKPKMTRDTSIQRRKTTGVPDYVEPVAQGAKRFGHTFKPEGATDQDIMVALDRSRNAGLISDEVYEILSNNILSSSGQIHDELNNYARGVDENGDMEMTDAVLEANFPRGMPEDDAGLAKGMLRGTKQRLKSMKAPAQPHYMQWYIDRMQGK